MSVPENALTNHEVTVCLSGGAVLGPFNATWSKDEGGDVRNWCGSMMVFCKGRSSAASSFTFTTPTPTRFIP